MRRFALISSAALVGGLVLAGCSAEQVAETKTQAGNAAVCVALQGLSATVEGLSTGVTGTGDITVGTAQEAVNQINQAYQTVTSAIQNLGTDVQDQVLTAQQQFEDAQMQVEENLSGLDGDATLSEAGKQGAAAIDNLNDSYQELNDSLGCGN